MFSITQTSEGGSIALTATTVTRQHDLVRFSQRIRATEKEILWSNGPWLGKEIGPAWENFYETQGFPPFETCSKCEFGEVCVLTVAPSFPSSSLPLECSAPIPQELVRKEIGLTAARGWGNASKTRSSLPHSTVEHNRRELVAFCQQCWQFTDFQHGKGAIGKLQLFTDLATITRRI